MYGEQRASRLRRRLLIEVTSSGAFTIESVQQVTHGLARPPVRPLLGTAETDGGVMQPASVSGATDLVVTGLLTRPRGLGRLLDHARLDRSPGD